MKHHTKDKGDLGVLKAQTDLCQKGYLTLNPATEHAPFDLVVYKDKTFKRVQVKYRELHNGKVDVKFASCWSDKHGNHEKAMDKTEVDVIAIYCPQTDKVYYIDPTKYSKSISLRVNTPDNNQKQNINFADDFLQVP